MSDRKSVKITGIDFLDHLDSVDPAHRAAFATPLDHLVNLVGVSFENGSHAAVRQVPDPACNSDFFRGITGICPEEKTPWTLPVILTRTRRFSIFCLHGKRLGIEHADKFIFVHYPYSQLLSLGQLGAGVLTATTTSVFLLTLSVTLAPLASTLSPASCRAIEERAPVKTTVFSSRKHHLNRTGRLSIFNYYSETRQKG